MSVYTLVRPVFTIHRSGEGHMNGKLDGWNARVFSLIFWFYDRTSSISYVSVDQRLTDSKCWITNEPRLRWRYNLVTAKPLVSFFMDLYWLENVYFVICNVHQACLGRLTIKFMREFFFILDGNHSQVPGLTDNNIIQLKFISMEINYRKGVF